MKSWFDRFFSRPKEGGAEILLDGNVKAQNVLVLTEHINATYFISFDTPLRRLHGAGQVNLAVASQKYVADNLDACLKFWKKRFVPDVVVMTRYGHPAGVGLLESFRRAGIRVIYHIDDDLLHLPDSLGSEIVQRHGNQDVLDTRRFLLDNCDLIYASTAELARRLQEEFPAQRVIFGIYAPYMGDLTMDLPPHPSAGAGPVIGYMGSKGHQKDLDLVVPALVRLLDERPTLRFEVFGTIALPVELQRFGDRVQARAVQRSYHDFLKTLATLRWDIGLAPLVDAPFNRCKAPTKYIEYSACGIPTAASKVTPYDLAIPVAGGRLVEDDWYEALASWLDDEVGRAAAKAEAQRHCERVYAKAVLERQVLDMVVATANNKRHNREKGLS